MMSQKRKLGQDKRERAPRPKKRIRKQKYYHSSSEDSEESDQGFAPVDLNDSDEERVPITLKPETKNRKGVVEEEKAVDSSSAQDSDEQSLDEDDEGGDSDDDPGITKKRKPTSKRNDPVAFSTSISKILSTKLSQSARKDPLLSRSREAAELGSARANEKLERRAKAKLRAERKEALERGRVKDVLGLSRGEAGETAEEEKRLRKIAQRGVVKLFNAVRAAQVKGEEAAKEERRKGTVGMANREEKVNEMSKQGFLELINGKNKSRPVEA